MAWFGTPRPLLLFPLARFVVAAVALAPLLAAQGTRLHPPVASGPGAGYCIVAADGSRVFFLGAHTGTNEIFDVVPDGSAPPRALSAALAPGRTCTPRFVLSPDESYLLYEEVDAGTGYDGALHVVPTDGSRVATRVSAPLFPMSGFLSFGWTPDGTRVLYNHLYGLFSVPADASEPLVYLGGQGADFLVTPDSSRVVYGRPWAVYTTRTDGSAAPQLLSDPPFDEISRFVLSPDGTRVIFADRRNFPTPPQGECRLFSAPIDDSAPPILLFALPGRWSYFSDPRVTADSQRVVLLASDHKLYSLRLDGSAAPQVLSELPFLTWPVRFLLDANSNRVVFECSFGGTTGTSHLFSVPADKSASPVLLVPPFRPTGQDFKIAHDRVFLRTGAGPDQYDLASAPLDGSGPSVKLSDGGNVIQFTSGGCSVSPDGHWVAYIADRDTPGVNELYVVRSNGQGPVRKLNAPLVPGGDVFEVAFVPGSRRIVYQADQDVDGIAELFTSVYGTDVQGGPPKAKTAAAKGASNPSGATVTVP